MGPKRAVFATATCAFFVGCYMTEGPSLDEAARKTKDAAVSVSPWPSFGDASTTELEAGLKMQSSPWWCSSQRRNR